MDVTIDVAEDIPEEEATAFAAVDADQLQRLAQAVGTAMHLSEDTELSVAAVSSEEMSQLHVQWMDLEGPTDVMSFPMDELRPGSEQCPSSGTLGDIALCPVVAARQAAENGHSTEDELCLLTVHGMLHCLGYDHGTAEEEAEMFGIQRGLLEQFLGHPAPVETRH